jgi:RNA polymerase sigma factor (sigma-70 family)
MDDVSSVAELVEAARAGDQAAWDRLVERFLPLVHSIAARHRLTRADADDVNQTVWLRLVEHLDEIRNPNALAGWIATTTRHESLRLLRLRGRTVLVDPLGPSPLDGQVTSEDLTGDLERAERHHALREALLELPEDRRTLLMMLLHDPPLSYGEISERLDIPVGSIGPTRARALAQLRETTALKTFIAADLAAGPTGR